MAKRKTLRVKKLKAFRTCVHREDVRIFEHNFVGDKEKFRMNTKEFLTQSAAKFAEKTCSLSYEHKF